MMLRATFLLHLTNLIINRPPLLNATQMLNIRQRTELCPETKPIQGPTLAQQFSRRVIARWLAGKLLKTKDAFRVALDGLGTVGRSLG